MSADNNIKYFTKHTDMLHNQFGTENNLVIYVAQRSVRIKGDGGSSSASSKT